MFESIAGGMFATLSHLDDANMVIGVFTFILLALFSSALVLILRNRAPTFYRSVPTLLTTFGILGTFLGISTGLLHFDVNDIEASIPMLLDGLKLAFVTSITGILLAVCLRLILVLSRDAAANADHQNPTSLANPGNLTALVQYQAQAAEAQLAAIQQLVQQVARLDDRLIQTLEHQHTQQLDAMRGFADQLSEMGSRQLITALESVIRDFNSNLGEQFGENFRRLDASVEKLLRWQDQYREHMESLGQQLDHATAGVAKSEASLQALTEQARQISCHVEDQASAIVGLRRESIELESLLGSIADLRDRAKEAFPAIDQRLKAMLESIENAVLSALSAQQRLGQYGMDGRYDDGIRHASPMRAHA
ncbi:hypothetical protein [Thiobaca trueperi]|uniref:MotA/TolQ/ExbB proton channel family protein n=1 Tax=Thiobaca trueperi TaxID=127458 RepID=A0A4R3N3H5_9GAMM|nr:hypothetical protein [Thiobaca trueperi]TCT21229.1 hypothetical protein EDC35_10484 [Thiobaca trueperi]